MNCIIKRWWWNRVTNILSRYTHIFFLPLEKTVKFVDDGERSTNLEFQGKVDLAMKSIVSILQIMGIEIIELKGTVEERLEDVMEYLGWPLK
jgi:hypothetical protein